MGIIKLDDIRDRIEELVSRAEAGETILIEKDGKTVARLEGVPAAAHEPALSAFDWDALRRFTDAQPMQEEPADVFIRRLRDGARY